MSYSVTIPGVPERDIELTLVYPKDATQYFYLEGKSLRLRTPIDRDPEAINYLNSKFKSEKRISINQACFSELNDLS